MQEKRNKETSILTIVALIATIAGLAPAISAQRPAGRNGDPLFETFSIAAVDPDTGEVGVAVTTRRPCVGNAVPWIRAGVGAVATQASTRVLYGNELLDLLEQDVPPEQALRQALAPDSEAARRQVAVIASDGRSAQHTGSGTNPWTGHRAGPNYVTQGNGLVGAGVLAAVSVSFEATAGSDRHLADRLIEALQAGQNAGGDQRKGRVESAAVVVADPRPGASRRADGITTFINVCEHATPVQELRRVYEATTQTLGFRTLQRFDGADVEQLRIMLQALEFLPADSAEDPAQAEGPYFYDAAMMEAVEQFRRSQGLAVFPRSPAGLVDKETVSLLWAALERSGKAKEVRAAILEITRPRR